MTKKKEAEEKKIKAPLSTMVGSGEFFFVETKKYRVKPLKLKEIDEFMKDEVNIGPQLFSMTNDTAKDKLDKWLQRKVLDSDDQPVTLQKAIDDDWDLANLKECMQKIIDISG